VTVPRSAFPWLTVVAILVVSLSLRSPMVAPTPVLTDIEADLGIDSAVAGLLTSLPVLAFAALTPLAALVIRRTGAEVALLITICGVLLGTVIRTIPTLAGMLAGMAVIGAAITIGNIVVPVIIRRDVPPRQVAFVTAAYTAFLNVGSLITALLTAPLAELIGWPMALLAWSVMTVAGVVLWSVHMRRDRPAGGSWAERDSGEAAPASADTATGAIVSLTGPLPVVEHVRGDTPVWRMPVAWLLLGSFAMQSAGYYSLTTWLPTIVVDELGMDRVAAGALASLFQGIAVVGAFLVPVVARVAPPIVPAIIVSVGWMAIAFGTLLAPSLLLVWIALGAIAHSGGFVVIFTRLIRVARSERQAASMSAFVQGGGYAVAAISPALIGGLHTATGTWTLPLIVIAAITVLYAVFLLGAHAGARS
jgi:MFS transporter, CP family, cyanate transporter